MNVGWMLAPAAACLIIAVALGWFGLHVLQRGVIFVDLALAQVAALGTTYAVFLGHEPDEAVSYALGLVFTVFGAVAFALARRFEERVPQEAIIGIAYAVSAGAASAMLDFAADPHGAEKLQHLMVGNVVWVTWPEIGALFGVCALVLAVHAGVARTLLAISFDAEGAERSGVRVAVWDMAFYLSFGLVITTVVHIAGVLLIFSYLIVPAVIARLFFDGVGRRLAAAYAVSVPVSIAGVAVSYEHAAGPIIVVLLAVCLVVALVAWAIARAPVRSRAIAWVGGGGLAVVAVLAGFSRIEVGAHHHDDEVAHAAPTVGDLPPVDPGAREAWYRGHATSPDMLVAAAASEPDPSLQLLVGTLLAKERRIEGLKVLAAAVTAEAPFVRMEADSRLRQVGGAGSPAYDPLAGPDLAGVWARWAAAPPAGWEALASGLTVP